MANVPLDDRRYTIICDSLRYPGTILGYVDPACYPACYDVKLTGHWTDDANSIYILLLADAQALAQKLHHNNARMVKLKTAVRHLMIQKHSAVRGQPTAHETLQARAATDAFMAAQQSKIAAERR